MITYTDECIFAFKDFLHFFTTIPPPPKICTITTFFSPATTTTTSKSQIQWKLGEKMRDAELSFNLQFPLPKMFARIYV